jgi:methyl-accepting chemotaxis protein
MTVSIASVADSVNDSLAVSERARELSADGETVVRDAATEIGYMASAVRDSGALVERLSEHSSRVSGIVRVIRDVADQTNLLALNAAIEAARAGELGRGFAVVADEVRKLAERTAVATTEIAEVIRNIEDATGDSVRGIKAAAAHVDSGVERASRAAEALVEIRSGTNVTLEHIAGIAGAAREQRSASQEIANNVEAIAHMATENDAAVHDIDATARDLATEASKLGTLVQRFRVA